MGSGWASQARWFCCWRGGRRRHGTGSGDLHSEEGAAVGSCDFWEATSLDFINVGATGGGTGEQRCDELPVLCAHVSVCPSVHPSIRPSPRQR